MYNTSRMVEFVLVLGEGVEGASFKECEAAFPQVPYTLLTRFGRGVVMGLRDIIAKQILTQLNINGALGCTSLRLMAILLVLGEGVMEAFLKQCEAAFFNFHHEVF